MNPPQAARKSGWQIRPMQIAGLRPTYNIDAVGLTIGRDPANPIVLDDQMFPHVSSMHARVLLTDAGPMVEDLDSKNGTYLNGQRTEGPTPVGSGDVIQLGNMGPSFTVYDTQSMKSTMALRVSAETKKSIDADFGKTTIINLKRVLGIPEESEGVTEMMVVGHQRARLRLGVVVLVLAAAMVGGFFYIEKLGDEREALRRERLAAELRALEQGSDAKLARERSRWEESRLRLLEDRERLARRLAERLAQLESEERVSKEEVDQLRAELRVAGQRLDRYDPVNLEQIRAETVRKAHSTVALVEANWRYRERESGELVYSSSSGEGQAPNFHLGPDQGGEPFTMEGTGSGFCVSAEGHILTNAHVVKPEEITIPGLQLTPEKDSLNVVFSGESKRIPARMIAVDATGTNDFALLKIEPFEGMPYMEDFSISTPPPPVGSDVWVMGFPLGKHALQEGESVFASAFRGSVSRAVSPYLQVDAAVHPGNSGGPLMDTEGRVIGVVVGVQTLPTGGLAPDMGYVLPIGAASNVWPPPPDPERIKDDGAGLLPARTDAGVRKLEAGDPPMRSRGELASEEEGR